MPRTEVKYTEDSINYDPNGDNTRWLDPNGHLYLKPEGTRQAVGAKFEYAEAGRWVSLPNGRAIVEAVAQVAGPDLPAPNERGAGLKADGGKGRWTLLMQGFPLALAGVVEVLGFGAKKYAAHSWRQVENAPERYRDALYRHLNALEGGELVDPESGLSHWEHICFNALALNELSKAVPNG